MSDARGQTVLGVRDAELDEATAARLWAASGAAWLTDRAVAVPGRLVRRTLGLVGELDARGAGLAELVPAAGLGLLAERAALMGLPPAGRISAGGATRLVECADGWIALSLARADDVAGLPAWLECEIETGPGEPGPDLWREVDRAVAGRASDELVERAILLGLPCGRVAEVDDARPAIADQIGEAAPGVLDGAVVVNLGSLWACPLAADVLARLGARVITVESTRRPDGGRLARRFFAALHGRTESVALDLSSDEGRADLVALLRCADVVLEGSRPRALRHMGIDARRLVLDDGPRIWLSVTAYGRTDPAADRVGFGDDAAAAGGLVADTRSGPVLIADAVADPLTGLTAALAVAESVERGGRWMIDVALARVAHATRGGWMEPADEPAARPRPRSDPGRSLPLGRDTDRVLAELLGADRRGAVASDADKPARTATTT